MIIKRDGRKVEFDTAKPYLAIKRAFLSCERKITPEINAWIVDVDNQILTAHNKAGDMSVEEIQDMIVKKLMASKYKDVAEHYIIYRNDRTNRRGNTTDKQILEILDGSNDYWNNENSNKNASLLSTQRDYMAGATCTDLTRRLILPKEVTAAHDAGAIHVHDADYFPMHLFNCCLVDADNMLRNGTVINKVKIDPPHSICTATTILSQIAGVIASGQLGGQTMSLSCLARFVDMDRQRIRAELAADMQAMVNPEFYPPDINDTFEEIIERRVNREIEKAIQTLSYQINTINSTNGQTPFISLCMYLSEVPEGRERDDLAKIIAEVLKQRIQGFKNSDGHWITPSFPKLLYVLTEENVHEDSKYFWLTKLAAQCTSKRLVPDYISEKKMKELKKGDCFPCMGCRSFLNVDPSGNHKYYGRFNKGVCTVNLPYVALEAREEGKDFYEVFDKYLELCHKALICRYERLRGTRAVVSPIHWMHGGISRKSAGDTIDDLLVGGYSTISLGYAGLWECVRAWTGAKLTDPKGTDFGLEVMRYMNKKCDDWNAELNLGFSIYGTPIESTTYKFAKALKKRFGVINDVSDKDYITNSYHVKVTEPIGPFEKLAFESQFQALSTGGAISYIECADLTGNIESVISVIQFIYENIMYAELNVKSDYCGKCGWDGEIEVVEDDDHKLIWRCPVCGNTDKNSMSVARRTCGST